MAQGFEIRALEIHDRVWDYRQVTRALAFMKRNSMNTLVLHANDIVDEVIWPAKYYGAGKNTDGFYENYAQIYKTLYQKSARRRYMPIHRYDFLQWVIKNANNAGIQVYLENKELWFPDYLEEIHPEVRKNGHLCASETVWFDFLKLKYEELMSSFPGLAGIIMSPGSRESKLSVSGNLCTCDKCKSLDKSEWYYNVIMSAYKPIKNAGKKLTIRDFVFDKKTQASLVSAFDRLPQDIIISLKNTPHDFYPTFPHNPKIGEIKGRDFWIEFDTMGQYFGWGIGISSLVTDIKSRIQYSFEKGARGVILRTDWEGLPSHSSFDTPNLINLYAGAMCSYNINVTSQEIYRQWLVDQELMSHECVNVDQCVEWIMSVLEPTWEIVKKSLFINDCVFNDSSAYPISIDHAFWLAQEKNSLADWEPSKANALELSAENISRIMSEKDEALIQLHKAESRLLSGNEGLLDSIYEELSMRFKYFKLYIYGFNLISKIAMLSSAFLANPLNSIEQEKTRKSLEESLENLRHHILDVQGIINNVNVPFPVFALLNPERLILFYSDVFVKVPRLDLKTYV